MWVVNDGQREPASAQLVLDRLDELGHRHARHDERRDVAAIVCLDGRDRAAHRVELLVRLDPAQLVDEREPVRSRSKPTASPRLRVVSAQTRSPIGDGRGRRRGRATTRSKIGEAVVGLVDDDHLALGVLAQVEGREHAREDEDGLGAGPEEGARDPAVRVRGLAEVRDLPLDAGQVLEVGRRREEERVDALGLQRSRRGGRRRSRVVEHHQTLSRGGP